MQESLGVSFGNGTAHFAYIRKAWGGVICDAVLDVTGPAADKVKEFLQTNKVRTRDVCAVARQEDVLYKFLTFPHAVLENLPQVIGYEFENHFPLSVDDVFFDHAVLNGRKSKEDIRVLVCVMRRDRLSAYRQMVEDMGLHLACIEPPLTARGSLFRWLQSHKLAPAHLLVLNPREKGMDAEIYFPGQWECKSFLSGPDLNEAVGQWCFKWEADARQDNSGNKDALEIPLFCLDKANLPDNLLNELGEYFPPADQTEIFTELGLAGVSGNVMHAFGAALSAIERKSASINFLPRSERRKKRRAAVYGFGVLSAFCVLLAVALMVTPFLHARQHYNRVEKELEDIAGQVKAVEQTRDRIAKLKKQIEPVSTRKRHDMLALLKELTDIIPQDSWLSQCDIERGRVSVRGESDNANALIALMENSRYFQGVKFSSPVVKRRGKDIFFIEMSLEE